MSQWHSARRMGRSATRLPCVRRDSRCIYRAESVKDSPPISVCATAKNGRNTSTWRPLPSLMLASTKERQLLESRRHGLHYASGTPRATPSLLRSQPSRPSAPTAGSGPATLGHHLGFRYRARAQRRRDPRLAGAGRANAHARPRDRRVVGRRVRVQPLFLRLGLGVGVALGSFKPERHERLPTQPQRACIKAKPRCACALARLCARACLRAWANACERVRARASERVRVRVRVRERACHKRTAPGGRDSGPLRQPSFRSGDSSREGT
jgi:hypothetical protein